MVSNDNFTQHFLYHCLAPLTDLSPNCSLSSHYWAVPISTAFLPVLFHIWLCRPQVKQNYSFSHEANPQPPWHLWSLCCLASPLQSICLTSLLPSTVNHQMLLVVLTDLVDLWFSTPLGYLSLDWPHFHSNKLLYLRLEEYNMCQWTRSLPI